MHDKLLDRQDALSPLDLHRYASELGLDTDRFTDDLHRHRYADHIAEHVASADAGTPSFFINGKRYEGAYDLAALTAAVRAAGTLAAAARLREPVRPGLRAV
jgi:protein-disulfide isomerase